MAIRPEGNLKTVVGIATPTRAYGAAFCACGATLRRATLPSELDAETYFAFLSTLDPGMTITYVSNRGTKRTGKFLECSTDHFVVFQTGAGTTEKIPAKACMGIQLSKKQLQSLPRRWTARGPPMDDGLLAALLEPDLRADFRFSSRLECVIVGNERVLREEAKTGRFAIWRRGTDPVEGYLHDVLRVRLFSPDGEGYRSEVYPASGGRAIESSPNPPLAIFDGSVAFLNRRHLFPRANWIVILDRTETRFSEATSELNQLFPGRRVDAVPPPGLPRVPDDMESILFGVSIR